MNTYVVDAKIDFADKSISDEITVKAEDTKAAHDAAFYSLKLKHSTAHSIHLYLREPKSVDMELMDALFSALRDLRNEVNEMSKRVGWSGHGARSRADSAINKYLTRSASPVTDNSGDASIPPGCNTCPYSVGDIYERDCGYPECSPPREGSCANGKSVD